MTRLANCPDLDTLQRFLSGRISEADAVTVEMHLTECPQCNNSLEVVPTTDDDLVKDMRRRSPLVSDLREQPTDLIERLQDLWTTIASNVSQLETAEQETGSRGQDLTAAPGSGHLRYDFLEPPRNESDLGSLGHYRVHRVIGRGGMGVVFHARDERLGRDVALKVLLDARYTDPHYVARFEREVEALSRLQHPHIVRVYEAGQQGGRPYLAMEYVAGGTLLEKLAGRPLGIVESAGFIETVARAVHYAHSQGILHRDLKPGNILLSALGGQAFVADFGLAKRADVAELTQTGDVLGTPGYIAPELASGSKESSAAVDTYSLGAILYELLIGRPPFRGENAFETLAQARLSEPVPLRRLRPAVPRDLETICLKCLAREPNKRYGTTENLADDLSRFLRGEPIRAKPASILEKLIKWTRRKPAAALLIVVTSLSAMALVAGSISYSQRIGSTLQQVQDERMRADAGYQSARDTLNRILTRLERRQVGEAPQLRELQRELLEDALTFYLDVLQRGDQADPSVRHDSAVACQRAAAIESMLGRWDTAATHFNLCLELIQGLPPALRDDPTSQTVLAACHNNIGFMANNNRRWEEAERQHKKALGIFERLAQLEPTVTAHRAGIAQSALNLGAVYQLNSRLKDAEPCFNRARDLHAELAKEFPQDESYRASLAHDYENLALLYQNTDRVSFAIESHEKADAALRPLVEQHPPGGEHALTLAAVCINWAYCFRADGDSEQALAKNTEAVNLVEAILRQEPNHVVARSRAYNAHGARAEMLDSLGRHSEAIADWDRVIEFDVQSDRWLRRLFRARSLADAGRFADAASAADLLVDDSNVSDEGLFNLACLLAVVADRTQRDQNLPADTRESLTDHCVVAAISLLRKLHQQDYFKDPAHAETLRKHEDLRSLRDRSEFEELRAIPPEPD